VCYAIVCGVVYSVLNILAQASGNIILVQASDKIPQLKKHVARKLYVSMIFMSQHFNVA
jgi:hypothetical protein